MTEQQKKQKKIACAFMRSGWDHGAEDEEEVYDRWLLTEEGKRLTAEPLITCPACEGERPSRSGCECCNGEGVVPDRRVIKGTWAVPEEKHRAAIESARKSEENGWIRTIMSDLKAIKEQQNRIEGKHEV